MKGAVKDDSQVSSLSVSRDYGDINVEREYRRKRWIWEKMINALLDMQFMLVYGHPGRVVHEAIRCMNLKSRGEVSGGGREHTHFFVTVEVSRMEAIM